MPSDAKKKRDAAKKEAAKNRQRPKKKDAGDGAEAAETVRDTYAVR